MNVLWAPANFVIHTATSFGLSPAAVALGRWSSLAVLLFGLLASQRFRKLTNARWPSKSDAIKAILCGALAFAPAHLIYYSSLNFTSTTEGTALGTTAPLWTAVLAFIFLRERVDPKRIVAILVGLSGAWIVAIGFALPHLNAGHTNGNMMYLSAVLLETGCGVATAKLIRRSSGITILAFQVLGAVPMLAVAPILVPKYFYLSAAGATWQAYAALAYLVLVTGLVCFGVWYRMVEKLPLSLMIVTMLLQPPLSALTGWAFLGEKITPALVIGTCVILSALLVGASDRPTVDEVTHHEQGDHDEAADEEPDVPGIPIGRTTPF